MLSKKQSFITAIAIVAAILTGCGTQSSDDNRINTVASAVPAQGGKATKYVLAQILDRMGCSYEVGEKADSQEMFVVTKDCYDEALNETFLYVFPNDSAAQQHYTMQTARTCTGVTTMKMDRAVVVVSTGEGDADKLKKLLPITATDTQIARADGCTG